MPANTLPTSNPEALRSFVDGSEQLRSYFTSGSGSVLKRAEQSFTSAASLDPHFQLAVFYRSLVQSELRETDSAIRGFEELLREGVKFQTEVLIHLAYALIKRYTDDDYFEAERLFDLARKDAGKQRREDLQLLVDALKVFLYAVMGGRLSNPDARPEYIRKALDLGDGMLRDDLRDASKHSEARFEVLNGLGIALIRKGQAAADAAEKQYEWEAAASRLGQALELRPNAVRAMQNMGLLRGIEALYSRDKGDKPGFAAHWEQARDWFARSLALNPNDQYPHYRLSQLLALIGDWEDARRYYASGRQQHGAVAESQWLHLDHAIENRDASAIQWH